MFYLRAKLFREATYTSNSADVTWNTSLCAYTAFQYDTGVSKQHTETPFQKIRTAK